MLTRRSTRLVAIAIYLMLGLGIGAGTADARAKPTVGNAREMAAAALDRWFNPTSQRLATTSAPSVDSWTAVRGCRRHGRSFRCHFNYMPGNTQYKGRLTVGRLRTQGVHFVGRVTAKGYWLRLPPKHHFRRSGTFRSLICGDACRR
jgi:hypothetical protein